MSSEYAEDALDAMHLVVNAIQDIAKVYMSQKCEKNLLISVVSHWRQQLQQQPKRLGEKDPESTELVTMIQCAQETIKIKTEYLEFLIAHDKSFRNGLKRRWEPKELQQHVLDDAKIYMAKITGFNSKSHMAMKPIDPTGSENFLKSAIEFNKDAKPELAARMRKWDTDLNLTHSPPDNI